MPSHCFGAGCSGTGSISAHRFGTKTARSNMLKVISMRIAFVCIDGCANAIDTMLVHFFRGEWHVGDRVGARCFDMK